ncbi:hypothetical protein J2X60_002993 [Curtobacterium sp. 320]|uniref:hypothetical protein n=1 Tax=Curtobacterium sp. 320 TaxID=2817749 RepID=UPI0028550208|nr:hypothetical protein [Curtobacterium sp. 320]MDR6574334.1 hypothetical protein [Curtobacterium sp. 320]
MAELTTDQRVALALIPTMQATAVAEQTFGAVAGDDTDLGRAAQQTADVQAAIGERVLELSEALAAGRVRIVDESELVREISRVFRTKLIFGHGGLGGEPVSQVREAQLFLEELKDRGVIR